MRNALLAAVATLAVAAPAQARDRQAYIGVDAGVLFANGSKLDVTVTNGGHVVEYDNAIKVEYDTGYDVDAVIGYDFGFIRAEAELAYKRAGIDSVHFNGLNFDEDDFDDDGHVSVLSGMANVLFDFGDENGLSFYAGGGVGYAKVKLLGESDNSFAWQLIAGARYAVSRDLDLGLKYRYFQAGSVDVDGTLGSHHYRKDFEGDSKFSSHSVLVGLTYNFGGHEEEYIPPPPLPPPPPPMQHCPDGSVIPTSYPCPEPPPPPPPPTPERGR